MKTRSVTPLLMVENNIMANTQKQEQLVSYRRSARSRDSELQRTSQFMSQFAMTHQNLESARVSEEHAPKIVMKKSML
jgi:hypothetical protein